MKSIFRNMLIASAIALPALASVVACDLDAATVYSILDGVNSLANQEVSCAQAANYLEDSIAAEGQLVDHINPQGDYSMALTLNATSINKLFRKATEWKYDLNLGIASIALQLPEISIGGCKATSSLGYAYSGDLTNCLSFKIPLEGKLIGTSGFSASATFGIPITAEIKGTEKSSLYVDLSKAQILDMSAAGSSTIPIARDLIETAILKIFSNQLTRVNLFDINAWEIGNNDIKMLAGAPRVNEMEGTLTFGMYSNLQFAQSGSVDWAYEHEFPKDAELGLHIHPDLIRGVLARMMYEKHIATDYTNGSTAFTITMADMAKDYDEAWLLANDPEFGDYFTFAFRMWSTENICGFMDILAGLKLEIDQQHFTIGVGNVVTGKSSGGMSLIAVAADAITSSEYFKGIMEYATYTFNFNEITVDDKEKGPHKAEMGSNTFSFQANGKGISLYLNFLDL